MKKTAKKIICLVSCMIIAVLIIGGLRKKVNAATAGLVELQPDKTYKSFDLDGDHKRDTIKLKTVKRYGDIDRIRIKINGKVVYKKSLELETGWIGMNIITLQNEDHYLYIVTESGYGAAGNVDIILQYKDQELQEVINFQEIEELKDSVGWSFIDKRDNSMVVAGNSLNMKLTMLNWSTGTTTFDMNFQYKNGKLQMKKKGQIEKKRYKVAKKFPLYKAAGKKAKAFTAKKGEWLTTEKYCIKKGKLYLQFSTDTGKKGWIKSIANPRTGQSPLFTNAYYHS